MRVFLFSSSTNTSGGSRQALYLAQGLAARGHEVSFLLPKGAELPALAPSLDWRLLSGARSRWREAVREILREDGPAVLHAFHNRGVKKAALWGLPRWLGGLGLRGRGYAVFGNRGVVFAPGNPLPYLSPGIDGFTVNSEACARVLAGRGVSHSRLFLVHNGVPEARTTPKRPREDVRAELGLDTGELLYGTVAGNKPVKGVDMLLAAFAELPARTVKLVVVGVDPALWRPQAEALGIAERVRLVERTEDVASYLAAMDVFVLPSRSESMPNTLLEAIIAGLPVIGSRVGGVPELIDENGLLVPADDATALARAMAELAEAGAREKMAAASRLLAPRFSLSRKVEATEAVYRTVLARRGLI